MDSSEPLSLAERENMVVVRPSVVMGTALLMLPCFAIGELLSHLVWRYPYSFALVWHAFIGALIFAGILCATRTKTRASQEARP